MDPFNFAIFIIVVYIVSLFGTLVGGWYWTRKHRYIFLEDIVKPILLSFVPVINTFLTINLVWDMIEESDIMNTLIFERKNVTIKK
jgi:uncharacterized membrane protein